MNLYEFLTIFNLFIYRWYKDIKKYNELNRAITTKIIPNKTTKMHFGTYLSPPSWIYACSRWWYIEHRWDKPKSNTMPRKNTKCVKLSWHNYLPKIDKPWELYTSLYFLFEAWYSIWFELYRCARQSITDTTRTITYLTYILQTCISGYSKKVPLWDKIHSFLSNTLCCRFKTDKSQTCD